MPDNETMDFPKDCANTILASHVREAFLDFLADCVFDDPEGGYVSGVRCAGLEALALGCGFYSLSDALKTLEYDGLSQEEIAAREAGYDSFTEALVDHTKKIGR